MMDPWHLRLISIDFYELHEYDIVLTRQACGNRGKPRGKEETRVELHCGKVLS